MSDEPENPALVCLGRLGAKFGRMDARIDHLYVRQPVMEATMANIHGESANPYGACAAVHVEPGDIKGPLGRLERRLDLREPAL